MTVSWDTNTHEHLTSLESASIPEFLQRCALVCESGAENDETRQNSAII